MSEFIAEAASVALAATLLAAATGKLVSNGEPWKYRGLAVGEIACAALLLVPPLRLWGLVAGGVLTVGFLAYAVQDQERECQCFGSRLPGSTRTARFLRIGLMLVSAAVGLLALAAGDGPDRVSLTGVTVGVLVGALIVVVPWLVASSGSVSGA